MTKKQGFTLIELAIVLVIVGLIVAAVLAGQSIITSSRVQAVLSQVKDYKTQVEIFEDKYAYLPGDMVNAEDMWPDADYATDNGDGDGAINPSNIQAANIPEDLLAWEHLYLAKLIPEVLTGDGTSYIVGTTIPATTFKPGGYRIASNVSDNNSEGVVNALRIDLAVPNVDAMNNSLFVPKVAEALDVKADDGLPSVGMVWGSSGADAISGCIEGSNLYRVNSDQPECVLTFFFEPIN